MTAVNLRTPVQMLEKEHSGITLSRDVRNIQEHGGLIQTSSHNVTKTSDVSEKQVTFHSEESCKVFDVLKRCLGPNEACKIACSKSLIVTDSDGHKVEFQSPFENEHVEYLTKIEVVKLHETPVEENVLKLSQCMIDKLQFIEKDQDPARKTQLANAFLVENGSHVRQGLIQYGGWFEWMVTWEKSDDLDANDSEKRASNILASCKDLKGSTEGLWYNASNIIEAKDDNEFQELKGFKIRVSFCGGNKNLADYTAWQNDIKKDDGHLEIVSCSDLLPVWKLLQENSSLFQDSKSFATFIETAWKEQVLHLHVSPRDKLLELLELHLYQEVGISIEDIRSYTLLNSKTCGTQLKDLVWFMIEKLMRMDYRCRDLTTFLSKHKSAMSKDVTFHPMDVMLVIFQSCDMMLQQVLCQKMSMSKIAIPFIIPTSHGNLELSLWRLRSIAIQGLKADGHSFDVSLVKHPFKIISFFRFGQISVSKSTVINHVLSYEGMANNTFLHRESAGGTKKRRVSNGLVEMAYLLPQPSDNKTFKDELLLLNLRGDAKEFQKQSEILSKISMSLVCFIHVKQVAIESTYSLLIELKKHCQNIVILLTKMDEDDMDNIDEEGIQKKLDRDKFIVLKSYDPDGSMSNAADIAKDSMEPLADVLKGECNSIQDMKQLFLDSGLIIDEVVSSPCMEVNQNVLQVLQNFETEDLSEAKKKMLPLQGPPLDEWTKLLKKKHRGLENLLMTEASKRNEDLQCEMQSCREKQLELSEPLQDIMKVFLDAVGTKQSVLGKLIFFKKIKIEVDDISRSILPQLRQAYLDAWTNRKHNLQGLESAGRKWDESSFGPEHLFREMGQLFECMQEFSTKLSPQQKILKEQLPAFGAQYFLSGHSLEIMNGDSGAVPFKWVAALLESLQRMIGKKRLFVLSVVGVQSSGKSTLLNTMFGLELAVGAGRCTRGVYAQLLPVTKSRCKLPVDYILVLDSEGLCSTSTQSSREHDNEIATLVIGLADLTIVNIRGENAEQMKDIFEIAVHAFLRMKSVKQHKKQRCIFLHHSVAAPDAKDKLMVESHRLQDDLDKITAEAAQVNNMAGIISKFNHVIVFNCEQNIFFIPDLWSGVQVNTGYSDKIQKIRDFILTEMDISDSSVTASDMILRLHDIWNGVLADDFLFSFKNNLSVKAYLALETKFNGLVWQVESSMLEHMNNKSRMEIDNCENKASLKASSKKAEADLRKLQDKLLAENDTRLASFFRTSELKEYLIQWEKSKMISLKEKVKNIGRQVVTELQYYTDCKNLELEKVSLDKSVMIQDAHSLAVKVRGKQFNEEILLREFGKHWDEWEKGLDVDQKLQIYNVEDELNRVIEQIFGARGHTKFLNVRDAAGKGEDITQNDMKKDYLANKIFPEDEKEEGKLWKSTDLVPKQPGRETFYPQVVTQSNNLLGMIRAELSSMVKENLKFHPTLARKILQLIVDEVDKHNALPYEKSFFSLTTQFGGMIAVRVARMAVEPFKQLNEKFIQSSSIKAKLEAFRNELSHMFINEVHQNLRSGAADFLYDKVKQQCRDAILRDMDRKALDKILEKVKYKKQTLLIDVLTYLAQKNDFHEYMKFAEDITQYCAAWIEQDGREILFKLIHGTSEYGMFAMAHLDSMMAVIKEGISKAIATSKTSNAGNRMEMFVTVLQENIGSTLPFTETDCKMLISQHLVDFDGFEKLMDEKLDSARSEVLKEFLSVTAETVEWNGDSPYKQAMDKLWGCKESCPLCSIPCQYTDENHVGEQNHSCLQHWPTGFTGTRFRNDERLSTNICNFSITTGSGFNCAASRFKCRDSGHCKAEDGKEEVFHPHRDYKTYLLNWDIEPDEGGEASMYWQWAMYEFQEQLAQKHQAEKPAIPRAWMICKDEAIKSLHKLSPDSTYI